MNYIIKHANGTYYQDMTPIGPMFGGTKEQALRFMTEQDAIRETTRHYGFVSTTIEAVEK